MIFGGHFSKIILAFLTFLNTKKKTTIKNSEKAGTFMEYQFSTKDSNIMS